MPVATNAPKCVRSAIAAAAAGLAVVAISACDKHGPPPSGAAPRQVTVVGSGQVRAFRTP